MVVLVQAILVTLVVLLLLVLFFGYALLVRVTTGLSPLPFVRKTVNTYAAAKLWWVKDPYDETYAQGQLMNWSEVTDYDKTFPDHPLSQARELVNFLIWKN